MSLRLASRRMALSKRCQRGWFACVAEQGTCFDKARPTHGNAVVLLGIGGQRCQRGHWRSCTPLGPFRSNASCKYRASCGMGETSTCFRGLPPYGLRASFDVAGKTMIRSKKASIRGTDFAFGFNKRVLRACS